MSQNWSRARLAEMHAKGVEEQALAPLNLLESWRWRPRSTAMGRVHAPYAIRPANEAR
jgi:hypothetical protein